MAGSKKKAVVTPKKPKKKRERKPEVETPVEEQKIVTVIFDDHEYTGYLRTDSLSKRCLDGAASKYIWQDGSRYEGPFLQSEIQGQGKYTWPDGSTYEGALQNGKRHGHGVFVAADGITKYEGQWVEGKRHGRGRLIFDAEGESFYDGEWCNGCKHGKGRQVWPSKNTYEGSWEEGRMQGSGTMTWSENGILEVYTGEWANNLPQGQGKYTWHATEDGMFGKEMPVQQTNNSFEGTWSKGLRSGYGTFQFANGSKYEGQWANNLKHGDGRYTYEDGRIYAGEFILDNMANNDVAHQQESTSSQALNLGGADNPVRKCVEIADLVGFCLPNDRLITDPTERTGFSEPNDVFREIYNILLRHLGDLKKLYASMRKMIQRTTDDPWLVYMFHMWILAREAGILAPDCSLARLNRRMVCGPRQHGEAFPEDVPDLRPLTPRSLQNRVPGDPEPKVTKRSSKPEEGGADAAAAEQEAVDEEEEDDYGDEEEDEEDGEDAEDAADGDEQDGQNSSRTTKSGRSRQSRASRVSRASRRSGGRASEYQGSRRPTFQSFGTRQLSSIGPIDFFFEQNKFWRLADFEAALRLVDVHAPGAALMFRHFLEALVRMTPAAFPEKQGLESMLKALLQERVLTKADGRLNPECCRPFDFLADANVLEVFGSFHSKLWELFKDNAAGVGAYALPLWAQLLDFEEESGRSSYRRMTARHFGGLQRRVHIQARMDVTIRVKDALSILFYADLLSIGDIQPSVDCPNDSIFPEPRPEETEPVAVTPDTEERSSLKNTFGDFQIEKAEAKDLPGDHRTPTPPEESAQAEGQKIPPEKEIASTAEALAEFRKLNFKVGYLDAVAILTEVFKPPSVKRIHWSLDENSAVEELAMLDYLETELTYPEFQLLLLRLANLPAEKAPHLSCLSVHACLDAFLAKVFLPAVQSAQSRIPPEPELQTAEGSEGSRTAKEESATEGADAEAEAAQPSPEKEPAPSLWLGFCDPYHLDIAATAAPRWWPEKYTDEVLGW